jgi:Protein tyrosine and serine/threonine kinase
MAAVDAVRLVLSGKRLEFPASCPAAVAKLALRAMEKRPEDRPTFAEIAEELDDPSLGNYQSLRDVVEM